MPETAGLIAVAAAFFVVAASPGPATVSLAAVSMTSGREAGLRFGMGLSVGLAFWGLVAATGLGALLQASALALTALKLAGGAYLLWLALTSARSAAARRSAAAGSTGGSGFARGLLLNLSNPKAVLAWMATLALGVDAGSGASQVAASTVLCIALGFGVYACYALLFSTPTAMETYERARRWIDGSVAALFAIAGFGVIRSAFLQR